jgi:hypothetical protein
MYSMDLSAKNFQERRYLMIFGQLLHNADRDTRSWLRDLRCEAPDPRNSVVRGV